MRVSYFFFPFSGHLKISEKSHKIQDGEGIVPFPPGNRWYLNSPFHKLTPFKLSAKNFEYWRKSEVFFGVYSPLLYELKSLTSETILKRKLKRYNNTKILIKHKDQTNQFNSVRNDS